MHAEIPTVCADEAHAEYIDGQAAKASNDNSGGDSLNLFFIRVGVRKVGGGQAACARKNATHHAERKENHRQDVLSRHLQTDTGDMHEQA